jgi:hypothetical protein
MNGLDIVVKDIAGGEFEVLGVTGGDVESREGMDKIFEDFENTAGTHSRRSREDNWHSTKPKILSQSRRYGAMMLTLAKKLCSYMYPEFDKA